MWKSHPWPVGKSVLTIETRAGRFKSVRLGRGIDWRNFVAPKFEIRKFVLTQADAKGRSLLLSIFAFFAPFRG